MRFVSFEDVVERLKGKSVVVVGSAPSVLTNQPGFIDSHDVVVRVNNYKLGTAQGTRTDVFYSFFGGSIKKTADDLKRDGVTLCMCKCPNDRPIECDWHVKMGKLEGIDFRAIYRRRQAWWFCDTFIPTSTHFLRSFDLLDRHIPTTGFAAILDVLACEPASLYLTGFDFFSSGVHNVDEKWREGDPADPIRHRPDLEVAWVKDNASRLRLDKKLQQMCQR